MNKNSLGKLGSLRENLKYMILLSCGILHIH